MGIIHSLKSKNRKFALLEQRVEYLINDDISNGRENFKLPATSYRKNDSAPNDYHYVSEFVQFNRVHVDTSLANINSCKCVGNCRDELEPCQCSMLRQSNQLIYNSNGRLSDEYPLEAPEIIRECNPACKCNKRECKNMVIQSGIKKKFALFRTKNRGWGIRAQESIKRGTFIGIYSGELISVSQSNLRSDDTYLFNLARTNIQLQQNFTTEQKEEEEEDDDVNEDEDEQEQIEEEEEEEVKVELHNEQQVGTTVVTVEEYLEQVTPSVSLSSSSLEPSEISSGYNTNLNNIDDEIICNGINNNEEGQQQQLQFDNDDIGCNLTECETNKSNELGDNNLDCGSEFIEDNKREEEGGENVQQITNVDENNNLVVKDQEHYVCDAKYYGNFTRFINHSCEPNVTGIRTYTKHQDDRFPYIAFFANRDIQANEELTLNYGDNYWLVKCKRDGIYCLCNKQNCRFTKRTFDKTLAEYNRACQLAKQ